MAHRPKMILFSHLCHAEFITGAEKMLLFMLKELATDYQLVLVVPQNGQLSELARPHVDRLIVLDIPLVASMYTSSKSLPTDIAALRGTPLWAALISLLDCERPDVVLVNTVVHPLPAMAAKLLSIPVIWHVHETIMRTKYTSNVIRMFEKYADYVIGVSKTVLAPLTTPITRSRLFTIYPSWNDADVQQEHWPTLRQTRRQQWQVSEEQLVIAYISAAIYEGKGLWHFMQMSAKVAEKYENVTFAVVGSPTDERYFAKCMSFAEQHQLKHRMQWVRFETDVATLFPAFDVVVVPSLTTEGFGLTALEALCFAKPLVVYRSGGLAEIADLTGNSARMAATGDVEGLTNEVLQLLAEPDQLARVGIRNRRAVIKAFGIKKYRQQLHATFSKITPKRYVPMHLIRTSRRRLYLYQFGRLRPYSLKLLRQQKIAHVRERGDELVQGMIVVRGGR